MVIISGKALWNTPSLRSFLYRIVVPQSLSSWKWANWSWWMKSSVGEAGSCHWWIFLLNKATRATCSVELVPWWGMFCHSLYKHRAGCGLPRDGLPGGNCRRLWSLLRWANPEEGNWLSGELRNTSTSLNKLKTNLCKVLKDTQVPWVLFWGNLWSHNKEIWWGKHDVTLCQLPIN